MRNSESIMFQFPAMTKAGCRRSFPRHLRHRIRHRMTALAVSAVVIFLAQASSPQRINADPTRRPNIVLIMADDLGWMDLHCQGNQQLDTPHLDRLASQGMRFTSAYAAAPVCTPTRAAIMTGWAPARLHITNHAPGNPDYVSPDTGWKGAEWTTHLGLEHVTIAERLQAAGYATGFFGKWHLSHRPRKASGGPREEQLRAEFQGFDVNIGGCSYGGPPTYFDPYRIPNITPRKKGEYLPERLADECITFLQQHRDKPFFLNWWNYAVHYPLEAPDPLIEKYRQRKGPGIKEPEYAAMLEAMDAAIGRVLQALDDLGLSDQTLVVFTSDNGSFNGVRRPLRGSKGHLYEGGIRVPMIVRYPGVVEANSVCSTPVVSTDLFRTLLQAARLSPQADEPRDGESLFPLLTQSGSLQRQAIYFHYPNYAFHKRNRLGSAIRQGQFKLIEYFDGRPLELYDLDSDIGEQTNLAQQMPQKAAALREQLQAWRKETRANLPVRVNDTENP